MKDDKKIEKGKEASEKDKKQSKPEKIVSKIYII